MRSRRAMAFPVRSSTIGCTRHARRSTRRSPREIDRASTGVRRAGGLHACARPGVCAPLRRPTDQHPSLAAARLSRAYGPTSRRWRPACGSHGATVHFVTEQVDRGGDHRAGRGAGVPDDDAATPCGARARAGAPTTASRAAAGDRRARALRSGPCRRPRCSARRSCTDACVMRESPVSLRAIAHRHSPVTRPGRTRAAHGGGTERRARSGRSSQRTSARRAHMRRASRRLSSTRWPTRSRAVLPFDGPADAVMSRFFRENAQLGRRDRSVVAEAIFFALRHYATLSWSLQPAAPARAPRLAALVTLARQFGLDALDPRALRGDAAAVKGALAIDLQRAPASVRAELAVLAVPCARAAVRGRRAAAGSAHRTGAARPARQSDQGLA